LSESLNKRVKKQGLVNEILARHFAGQDEEAS
jgi:hypothetical protein